MKKNLTMQLLPLWLLAFFFLVAVPISAQQVFQPIPTQTFKCGNPPFNITAQVSGTSGTVNYEMYFNGKPYRNQTNNPTFTLTAPGIYRLKVTNGAWSQTRFFWAIGAPVLHARAIVVKQVGCATGANANKGLVRIVNPFSERPAGGFEYSFDNKRTWTTTNEAWLSPGIYKVYVRSTGNDCDPYEMTVGILKPKFEATVQSLCTGKGVISMKAIDLETLDGDVYQATYSLDGGTPQTNPVFSNVTAGVHTITATATRPKTRAWKTIFLENFGNGNFSQPNLSISKYYYYETDNTSNVEYDGYGNPKLSGSNPGTLADGEYYTKHIAPAPTTWGFTPNHIRNTLLSKFPRILYIPKYASTTEIHSPAIYTAGIEVLPNEEMRWTFDAFNMVSHPAIPNNTDPVLQVRIYATLEDAEANNNNYLYQSTPYTVAKAANYNDWKILEDDVPSTTIGNRTKVYFQIRNLTVAMNGNDLAIDNIRLIQKQDNCAYTFTDKIEVDVTAKTPIFSPLMTYNCGANTANLTVTSTIATGFDYTYKVDNGSFQTSNVFNNLSVGTHTVTVSYKYTTVSNTVVLFSEDFGSGIIPMKSPYINDYAYFESFTGKRAKAANGTERPLWPAGDLPSKIQGTEYSVLSKNFGDYDMIEHYNIIYPNDPSGDPYGRSLLIFQNNYHAGNYLVYEREFDVIPGRDVRYSFRAFNIIKTGISGMNPAENAALRVQILDSNNVVLQTFNTTSAQLPYSANADQWVNYGIYTLPAATLGTRTKLKIRITNPNATAGMSTGYAIDDIIAVQDAMLDACTTSFTITVAPKVTRAFAGVTKLIGCGTGANANKAEVTIANVEGGSGAYEYNFGGTWTTTNAGWLAAGTHTVSVRAVGTGNSCAYDMSVTVPNSIAQPTIKKEVFYDCDGKAVLKVGVENPDPELTYMYSLDGAAFTTTYVYTNVASGTHSVNVQYAHREVPSPHLLFKEDFGKGDPYTTPPLGMTPSYGIVNPRTQSMGWNKYFVAGQKDLITTHSVPGSYIYPNDHTNPTDNSSRFMAIDFGNLIPDGAIFYQRDIHDVKPNQPIEFEMYGFNLQESLNCTRPVMIMEVIALDNLGNVVQEGGVDKVLGRIESIEIPVNGANPNAWYRFASDGTGVNIAQTPISKVNPGSYTNLRIRVRTKWNTSTCNDFAFDDLAVYQMPAACGQVVTTTATVTPLAKPSFSANVSNCSNTNSTITWVASPTTGYTYTYTLQGGTATSSNVFNGLAIGNHTFTIDYKVASETTITILKEDFGAGTEAVKGYYTAKNLYFNTNKSGAYTAYNANGQGLAHNNAGGLQEYEYTIAHQLIDNNGNWNVPNDHSGKANGRIFFVNPTTMSVQDVYLREVSVLPNRALTLSAAFFNLVKYTGGEPQVQLAIYDKVGGILLGQTSLFVVPKSDNGNSWHIQSLPLTAAQLGNRTSVYIVVRMLNTVPGNHDLAVDDIVLTQAPLICSRTVTATVQNQVQKAFAGVTKLIGCGTGANANKAEVTIANVEGGSGTYEYQFDGLTWTNTNTGWLSVGTHTVSVRDSVTKSCAYDMSVTVPAAIAQPTIKTAVHYACDGKAILNIGVENPDPALKYLYSLDGAAYTTTYVYTGVTSGTHSVSVQYEHRSVPSPSLLFREDFGVGGKTRLPADREGTGVTYGGVNPGYYEITNSALFTGYTGGAGCGKFLVSTTCAPNHVWTLPLDHTSGGTDPQGRFFAMNGSGVVPDGELFYKRKVTNIKPGKDIKWEFYIMDLCREDEKWSGPCALLGGRNLELIQPDIRVQLVDNGGNLIAAPVNTGVVPRSICSAGMANWHKYEGTFNPGTHTEFTIEFRSNGSRDHAWGNDFVIDDITVYQDPDTCGQVVSTTQIVTANNQDIPAFTVSKTYDCATGKGALTVTPTATTGFTYTYTLGGTTYTSTTATFTGLDLEQTYTVSVSYQAVSNTITLLNEDFGTGTITTSPYIPSEYNYRPYGIPAKRDYRVAKDHNTSSSDWYHPTDHTNKPNGRMLFLWPKDEANEIIYQREISVIKNKEVDYSVWVNNYVMSSSPLITYDPQIQVLFYKTIADVSANNYILVNGAAPEIKTITKATSSSDWKQLVGKLSATSVGNAEKLIMVIKSHRHLSPGTAGNDFAIDDIVVTQKLSACTTSVTATLTKGDVATPTLTVPANLTVVCSAPTASATISSWIASATATSTCGTATVTHNYSYPSNLCNVGGTVTVTFRTTDPFGNVVTATRVISFATMTLTVTPTTLSVPNGALGGTTSSVVPNITLGGVASPSTNSVTITFSGLPTGVTSTTGGRLIVAPNTPAGTHTITYRVCETAGNNNCKTVNTQLVIGAATPTVSTETFTASTTTATVVPGTIGNILTNASVGTRSATAGVGGNVTITLTHTPTTSNAPQINPSTGSVTVSSNTPPGVYTITYTLCSAVSTCVPGVATITVPQLKPYIPNTTITHSGTQTTTRNILDGGKVNGGTQSATVGIGGTVTITSVTNPTPRTPGAPVPTLNPATGIVTVPPTTPNGTYTISYTVCTTATPTNCTTGVTTVVVANVTPTVVPDAFTASTTTATVVPGVIGNVLTNDRVGTQSATTGVGGNVTINVTRTPTTPNAPVLDASTGSVTVSGNTPAGVYSISYEVCNGALCTAATLTVTVPQLKPYIPAANITHSGTTTTTYTVTTGGSVKGGTQSATTGTGGTVTITNVVNPTPRTPGAPVPSLNPNNGVITVPPTTPNGVYTITYDVCTTATPTACSSHVATVTVGSVTPTEVPEANDITAYTRINTPVTVGVTSSTTVTVSIPSQPANGTAVSNGDGSITYTPNNGFKGTDSFEYTLCNAAGCRTATISVRVTSELIIYNGVSIGGSDKNNHFHIEGIENYPNNTVRIYNRWGVKVFEMSGYNNTTKAFKGVSDARATLEASDNLPQGTYYYIIEYVDEHNKTQTETGWLYLKKN